MARTVAATELAPNITLIPAKRRMNTEFDSIGIRKRVVAYFRVSTEEDNQQNSYATQVNYYTELITSHPDWDLVGIFADEGISGTQMTKRAEFKKMIKLCRRKKIDLILCKSISRFARNTVDCLDTVRELKALGINVKFEKENIETLSATSEFTISLYASFAQAESESISKNVTWGIEKAFQEGRVRYVLHQTLGYRAGEDGKPVIVEDEAKTVRLIFKMFAEGHSMGEIATYLTENAIPKRNGDKKWNRTNVQVVLQNEKYVGDAILQKTYTVDCLTHERAKNTGQKPQYYIRDCHEAIVDRDTWDRVHLEFARRSAETKSTHPGRKYVTKYCLSDILICPHCGATFKRTMWKSYGRNVPVWRCGNRLEHGKKICTRGVSVHEDRLHRAVLKIINDMISNSDALRKAIEETMSRYREELTGLETEITELTSEVEKIETKREEILAMITGSSFEIFKDELKSLNSLEYESRDRLEKLQIRKDAIQLDIKKALAAREIFITTPPLTSFEDATIRNLVEKIEMGKKNEITVIFRGGVEVIGEIEK